MSQVLISVIVPCYNQAQYLDECLQSVLDQTYTNWECIIVNDGSPDNTEEVALEWTEKDPRFIYLKKENGGVASARNFGIERAKGEWILPLDGDDKLGKDYLDLASLEFHKQPTIIYCKAKLFGLIEDIWNIQPYSYEEMLTKNHIFCTAFFKKENWLKVGGFDKDFTYGLEDWDFWLSILTPTSLVVQMDYYGFFYRKIESSREIELNKSSQKILSSEKKIFTKHLDKYLIDDSNPILNFKIQTNRIKKLNTITKEISRNIVTKILYKIIEKIQ